MLELVDLPEFRRSKYFAAQLLLHHFTPSAIHHFFGAISDVEPYEDFYKLFLEPNTDNDGPDNAPLVPRWKQKKLTSMSIVGTRNVSHKNPVVNEIPWINSLEPRMVYSLLSLAIPDLLEVLVLSWMGRAVNPGPCNGLPRRFSSGTSLVNLTNLTIDHHNMCATCLRRLMEGCGTKLRTVVVTLDHSLTNNDELLSTPTVNDILDCLRPSRDSLRELEFRARLTYRPHIAEDISDHPEVPLEQLTAVPDTGMPRVKQLDEETIDNMPNFPNLRKLTLDFGHVRHSREQLIELIHDLPALESLELWSRAVTRYQPGAFKLLADTVMNGYYTSVNVTSEQDGSVSISTITKPFPALKRIAIHNRWEDDQERETSLCIQTDTDREHHYVPHGGCDIDDDDIDRLDEAGVLVDFP
ncbi:hypothetical protein QBC35DRAFT_466669 [Podospora australis]|uniref:Uncharacterized protein n=1 Tax=Podospora australis TaxID=1536484 RepID=A0AAN7AF18_9PEZI|nr:hypothetical protein QBC35DRAFT_466669 [Podospora australis]